MIRVSTLIWIALVSLSGYAMFQVKAEVGRLDRQLAATSRQIADDRAEIRTLSIEWAMLNQPARLDALSKRVLQLSPIRTYVLGSFEQPPMREDAAPSPTPGAPIASSGALVAEVSFKAKP
ncbi:MAG: cell division protein FtsL [Stellaceae bacterium]